MAAGPEVGLLDWDMHCLHQQPPLWAAMPQECALVAATLSLFCLCVSKLQAYWEAGYAGQCRIVLDAFISMQCDPAGAACSLQLMGLPEPKPRFTCCLQ